VNAPPPPAAQIGQLAYFIGTFDCEGTALQVPVKRKLISKMDLDGHWLFMRIDEAPSPDRPHPVCGNWQMTFDRAKDCFVSVWTDTLGRWAVQTSPGWEDDRMMFTGDIPVDGKPGTVRDILVRRSADEMLFLVEFRVDGAWTRYLDTTCKRLK